MSGKGGQRLLHRHPAHRVGVQHHQPGRVVAYVEAALPDLAEGHQGEGGAFVHGQVGEVVHLAHRAGQHLHGPPVETGGGAPQQGEGRGVRRGQPGQVEGGFGRGGRCRRQGCSFPQG
ncbi:hypothetical protein ACFQVA_08805 [Actinomadura keratinilytica]